MPLQGSNSLEEDLSAFYVCICFKGLCIELTPHHAPRGHKLSTDKHVQPLPSGSSCRQRVALTLQRNSRRAERTRNCFRPSVQEPIGPQEKKVFKKMSEQRVPTP